MSRLNCFATNEPSLGLLEFIDVCGIHGEYHQPFPLMH